MDYTKLAGKVIKFNKIAIENELDFGVGQRARVISANLNKEGDVIRIDVDFKEFEEENKKIAERCWYDDNGKPCLAWHETKGYPKNCKTEFYADPERVANNEEAFDIDATYEWAATEWRNPAFPNTVIQKVENGFVVRYASGTGANAATLEEAVKLAIG
jgi:hypothetical protein